MVQHALCAWDSFWCTVEQGIKDAAKDMGVDVTILGPDKFDLEKTASLIDQATAAKPDGIGLTVTDPQGKAGSAEVSFAARTLKSMKDAPTLQRKGRQPAAAISPISEDFAADRVRRGRARRRFCNRRAIIWGAPEGPERSARRS